MNKANYAGHPARNFPLSTEGLDFIQQQIQLVAEYAKSAGGNFILSGCQEGSSQVSDGILIINGEIIQFKGGTKRTNIRVVEIGDDVTAAGYTYTNAYIRRYAEFGENLDNVNTYNWSSFVQFPTNKFLFNNSATKAELLELQNLAMPKGAIIMWSGEIANIPNGYVLCDGRAAVNGVTIPDLRGKFIAGYYTKRQDEQQVNSEKQKYHGSMRQEGGKAEVVLEIKHMPPHDHTIPLKDQKWGDNANNRPFPSNEGTNLTQKTKTEGSGLPHENLPPYYTLAFIIKIV